MADCIEIKDLDVAGLVKVLKVTDFSKENTSVNDSTKAKKPFAFETHDIEPTMYYDLFFAETNDAFNRIAKVVKNSNAIKKLFGSKRNASKDNLLFKDLYVENATQEQKEEIGQRMQIRGLVMKNIIGTMKSDTDVQSNLAVNKEDAEKLFNGQSRKIGTVSMATALGREIAYSMGFKMSADPVTENRIYNTIGMQAIKELEDNTGIVTTDKNDTILNNKLMKNKYDKYKQAQTVIPGHNTVRINYEALIPNENNHNLTKEENSQNQHDTIQVAVNAFDEGKSVELMAESHDNLEALGLVDGSSKYIHRMSVPSNLAVPTEFNTGVKNGKEGDLNHSQEMNKLLNDIQDTPGEVNPRVGKFFLHLNRMVKAARKAELSEKINYDFESIIKDSIGDDKDLLNFIFGTIDTKAGVDTKNKAIGQTLSKTSTVKEMIEDAETYFNEDGSAKPIFFEHEMYRTGRVGYVQSILNPQTDKFFSRFVLDGGEYEIKVDKKGKEYIQLINGIEDDSGLTVQEILGENKDGSKIETTKLDNLLAIYNEAFDGKLKGDAQHKAEKDLYAYINDGYYIENDKKFELANLNGSLWQQLSSLEAINDIRNPTNGTITTRFQTKPDATGSGIVLQLLQMIGYDVSDAGAKEKLSRLGLLGEIPSDFINDVYGFLEEAIKKGQTGKTRGKGNDANKFINNMVKFKFVKNIREVAKPTTMVTSYLAGEATVKAETGKAYVDAIFEKLQNRKIDSNQLKFIIELIGKADPELMVLVKKNAGDKPITPNTILTTPGVKAALESHLAKTVGAHMYTLIGEALTGGAMQAYQAKVIDLYGKMKNMAEEQDRLIKEGKADKKSAFQLKTLPTQIVLDRKNFKDSDSWWNHKMVKDKKTGKKVEVRTTPMTEWEILQEYGMMITSPSQTLEESGKEDVLVMREGMNALTSLVNVTHSSDSAILFRAHQLTRDAIKRRNFSMSIHDANNADAIYNAVFQDMYRQALKEVVSSYDLYGQMVNAYKLMSENKSDLNTAVDEEAIIEMEAESKAALKEKEKLIKDDSLNLNSDKIFGFNDELNWDDNFIPEPLTEEEFKKKVTNPKEDVKTEEFEISTDQYTWAKDNPFPWKTDAPHKSNIMDYKVPTKDGKSITFDKHMKQSYDNVKALIEGDNVWYIYDTETTSKDNPEMIQLGVQKMKGNRKVGKVKEFFFTADKIEPGATKVHGYDVGSLQKKFDTQGLKDNNAVLEKINKLTGDSHMVAYNAKFDVEAVQNTEKKSGVKDGMNVDPQYDALGATLKIAQDQGVKLRRSSNTLKDAAQRAGIVWKDDLAHDAKYDVDQTANMVLKAYKDPANSMRQRYDKDVGVYSPDNKIDEDFILRAEPLEDILDRMKEKSETVKDFLKRNSTDKFKWGEKKSFYQPSNHTISLVNNAELNDKQIQRILEHEIFHHDTVAYLHAHENDPDVKFLTEVAKRIKKDAKEITPKIKGKRSQDLFVHMTEQDTEIKNLAELTAIFKTEPEALKPILNAMGYPATQSRLRRLIRKITDWFKGTNSMQSPYTADEVMEAVYAIERAGKSFDRSSASEEARKDYIDKYGVEKEKSESPDNKKKTKKETKVPPQSPERKAFMKKIKYKPYEPVTNDETIISYVPDKVRVLNNWTSTMIQSVVIDDKHTFKGQKQLEAADEYFTNNFPIYSANRNALLDVLDHNKFVVQMKGFLNPNRFGKRIEMERMIAAQDKATQERNTTDNNMISNMNKLMSTMTKEEIANIFDITSQAPIFNLADDGIFKDIVFGDKDLEVVLNELEGQLKDTDKRKAERMSQMLVGDEHYIANPHDAYNSETAGLGDKVQKIFEQVVALKTIQKTPNYKKGLKLLSENVELYNLIRDASNGLKARTDLLYAKDYKEKDGGRRFTDAKRYRENLIMDVYKEEFDMEAITLKEYNEGKYSTDDGWKLLRRPKKNEYGVAYRKAKDETYQQGAGTTISYKHTDVIVPKSKEMPSPTNVLSTDVGIKDKRFKVVLTAKEKDKLGLIRNPSDALYRAYSRITEIEETQHIRDLLLTNEFTNKMHTANQLKALDEDLKTMKPEDRKWLLALPEGVQKADVMEKGDDGEYKYPNIKKYYKVPEKGVTSVGNFRHNFDLVRIDAEPWLTGYKDAVLFENTPSARRIAYAVRQMVKFTKIHWTALSPVKIMNDAISNTMVLVGYDVPPNKIVSYGRDVNKQIGEFEQLRIKELNARLHGRDKEAARYAKQIENHPMSMMMHNGLMQSINVETLQRDASVVTGLQKDMEEMLNKFILLPDGKKSNVFKAVEWLQKHGNFGVESILEFASKGSNKIDALDSMGKQFKKSEENIKGLRKSEKDEAMAKYVLQFIGSPESEAVQLGSSLVQRADIVARGILVKDMMDKGATEEEAIIEATDAFINYKQNMPKELKILSDYGVLLFPSFWMRIQKVIWSLLKRNPATAAGALAMEEVIHININTVFDANLMSKYENGMFGLPPVFGFFQ